MNLLIVDDEYFSVEWVRKTLEDSPLSFRLFCAYSMAEAQAVFAQNPVDILVSDIEMPKGSGLELLEWVRREGYSTTVIFLTTFASFEYASKALKLQSADYLLKPVSREELLQAVEKAICELQGSRQEKQHAEYWNDTQAQSVESFWGKVATGGVASGQRNIQQELRARRLPSEEASRQWLPVLLRCLGTGEAEQWERQVYEYAVKNILIETLFSPQELPVIPSVGERSYLILRYFRPEESAEERERQLAEAFRGCTFSLPGVFHFFPAKEACGAEELAQVCRELEVLAENAIYGGSLIFQEPLLTAAEEVPLPPWRNWNELLLSKKGNRLQAEVAEYLSGLSARPQASRRELVVFQHDFLQMIYSLLEKIDSFAHELFRDDSDVALSEEACRSAEAMQVWVNHILAAYDACMLAAVNSSDVVEAVKQYVEDHLADELNRGLLAEKVFLSPDYLSHLFAKKTGISLTDYINARRISCSKKLLMNKCHHIRDVALKSGFQSISYFSKQFKRQTGVTPQEFRKLNLK